MDARHLRISVDEEPPRIVIILLTELLDTMESIGFGDSFALFLGQTGFPRVMCTFRCHCGVWLSLSAIVNCLAIVFYCTGIFVLALATPSDLRLR